MSEPECRRRDGERGYYVVDRADGVAIRGPYPGWQKAVREAALLNERRSTGASRVEVRVVGAPAEAP